MVLVGKSNKTFVYSFNKYFFNRAFASLGALESAYLIKGKTNSKKFDLSEQELLGCARKNGCKGGTSVDAFNYILNNDGITDESTLPYDKVLYLLLFLTKNHDQFLL